MARISFSDVRDEFARAYLTPMLRHGATPFVSNVHARIGVVEGEGFALPLSLDPAPHDSYVVSPLSHYVHYGAEELEKLGRPRVEAALRRVLSGLERPLGGLERAVYVNNWLLSTNLWPNLTPAEVRDVLDTLLEAFPDRPIVWRSLDTARNALIFETLRAAGALPVFSRVIHYQDPRAGALWKLRQVREDARRVKKVRAELVTEFTDAELARVKHLYDQLYLEKYSAYNAQFTAAFLRHAPLELRGWRVEGELVAAFGAFARSGVMTVPVFGYDTATPKELALYRLLSLDVLRRARERGLLVNASGGVGAFKKARGGVSALEYSLVFARHLPRRDRLAWHGLGAVLNRVAVPIILRGEF